MKDIIKTKDAKKGGYLVGKPHSEGGIKGINVDTNEPIEVEGGEVVITKPAVESQKTYELDGVPMKPRDILSKINSDHGGVKFKDGGEIDGKYDDGGKIPLSQYERQAVNESRLKKAMELSSIGKEGIIFIGSRAIDVLIKEIVYEDGKYLAKCNRKSESDTYSGLGGSFDLDSIVQINDFVYLNPTNIEYKELPGFYGGDYLLADPKKKGLQADVYLDPAPLVPYAVIDIYRIKNKRILFLWKNYIDEEGKVAVHNCFYAYEPIEEDIFEDVRKETGALWMPFIKYDETDYILIKNYGNNRIPFKDLPDAEGKKGSGFRYYEIYPPTKNEIVLEDSQYFGQIGFTMSLDTGLMQKKNLLFYNYTNFDTPNNLYYLLSNGGIVRYEESRRFIETESLIIHNKPTPLFLGDKVLIQMKDSSKNPNIHKVGKILEDNKTYYSLVDAEFADFDDFAKEDSGLKISTQSDGKVYSKSMIGEIVGFRVENRTSPFTAADEESWRVEYIYLKTVNNKTYWINLNDFYLIMVIFGDNKMRSICPAYEDGGETQTTTAPTTTTETKVEPKVSDKNALELQIQSFEDEVRSSSLKGFLTKVYESDEGVDAPKFIIKQQPLQTITILDKKIKEIKVDDVKNIYIQNKLLEGVGDIDELGTSRDYNCIELGDFLYINPYGESGDGYALGQYQYDEDFFSKKGAFFDPAPYIPWQVKAIFHSHQYSDIGNFVISKYVPFKIAGDKFELRLVTKIITTDPKATIDSNTISLYKFKDLKFVIIKNYPFRMSQFSGVINNIVTPTDFDPHSKDAFLIGKMGCMVIGGDNGDSKGVIDLYKRNYLYKYNEDNLVYYRYSAKHDGYYFLNLADKNGFNKFSLDRREGILGSGVHFNTTEEFENRIGDYGTGVYIPIFEGDEVVFQIYDKNRIYKDREKVAYSYGNRDNWHYSAISSYEYYKVPDYAYKIKGVVAGFVCPHNDFTLKREDILKEPYYQQVKESNRISEIILDLEDGTRVYVDPKFVSLANIKYVTRDSKYVKSLDASRWEKGGEIESAPQVEPTTIDEPTTIEPQDSSEAMIQSVKKKDETDAFKYELLLESLDDEETKLVVLRAINKDNPVKIRDIDRRLDEIARKRGEYDLKRNTALELLDKFEEIIELPKATDEEPTGESITGEPSQLTEYQKMVVNSPNFKSWFGDWITAYELDDYNGVSKAVSPITREPLVLYHGTGDDFTKFTFDKFPAAYFADNWSYSQWFASQKSQGGGGQIYEVFLSMKNPINLQSFGLNLVTMEEILNYIEQNYNINRYKIFPQLQQLESNPEQMSQAMNLRLRVWQFVRRSVNFIKYLKEETFYDGILMFEDNPDDMLEGNIPNSTGSYVVFFTSQIKWANAKFYNPYIEDNRFKHGGLIKYFSKQRK
jgi:hypothetical protein